MFRRKRKKIGKNVGGFRYVHKKYLGDLDEVDAVKVQEALDILEAEKGLRNGFWNVVKFIPGQQFDPGITFLEYREFDRDPHPELIKYYRVDASKDVGAREKEFPGTGYILHRKELMVGDDHPNRAAWESLTAQEEAAGLYDKEHRNKIGRLTYWEALLKMKGLGIRGYVLYTKSNAD